MASPIDIESALDSIISAKQLEDMGCITPKEFEEMKLVYLSIARKYAAICLQGKLRVEDIE